jgi:hypothetical protein
MSPIMTYTDQAPPSSYSVSLDDPYSERRDQLRCASWWLFANLTAASISLSSRQSVIDTAAHFGSFERGWLGTGAEEIPLETAARVVATAKTLEKVDGLPDPELTPNANGTISLEWESPRGEVYIEFGRTLISGFLRVEDEPTVFFRNLSSLPDSFFSEVRDRLYPPFQANSVTSYGAALNGYMVK